MPKLSVTRAKDRQKMVERVHCILTKCEGASVFYCAPKTISPRQTGVEFCHADGLAVTITFDGDDRQDRDGFFCMAWHISGRWIDDVYVPRKTRISDAFGYAMRASVNPYHFGKCTAFGDSFEDLCAKLERAVAMINDGTAYRAAETCDVV